jgi:beta-phosphoglucomutase
MEQATAEVLARYAERPTHQEYVDRLAGLADELMVREWLGEREDEATIVQERIDAYRRLATGGDTIDATRREVVRSAAHRVPIAIVSGAARSEIDPIVRSAGIDGLFTAIVTSDDVRNGKPHPEGYLVALELLRGRLADLEPSQITVIEDTEAGVIAAKDAGMRCLALLGTMPADRFGAADEVIETIDLALLDRLL